MAEEYQEEFYDDEDQFLVFSDTKYLRSSLYITSICLRKRFVFLLSLSPCLVTTYNHYKRNDKKIK